MQIVTERLVIRKGMFSDVELLLDVRNSEFVLQYNCMTQCSYKEFVQEVVNHDESYVIALKDSGLPIGIVDIHEDSLRYGIASKELSYYLNEEYTRCGYMKEALLALIKYLFEQGLDCISARAFVDNVASHKLLLSIGMHLDGVIPRCVKAYKDSIYDDGIYSILKEEFYAKDL